jgi:hypothetical protein
VKKWLVNGRAGGAARPTTRNTGLGLVAQAVPPAILDFFTASQWAIRSVTVY